MYTPYASYLTTIPFIGNAFYNAADTLITHDYDYCSDWKVLLTNYFMYSIGCGRDYQIDDLNGGHFGALTFDDNRMSRSYLYERNRNIIDQCDDPLKFAIASLRELTKAGIITGNDYFADTHVTQVWVKWNIPMNKSGTKNTIVKACNMHSIFCRLTGHTAFAQFTDGDIKLNQILLPMINTVNQNVPEEAKIKKLGVDRGGFTLENALLAKSAGVSLISWGKNTSTALKAIKEVPGDKEHFSEWLKVERVVKKGQEFKIDKRLKVRIVDGKIPSYEDITSSDDLYEEITEEFWVADEDLVVYSADSVKKCLKMIKDKEELYKTEGVYIEKDGDKEVVKMRTIIIWNKNSDKKIWFYPLASRAELPTLDAIDFTKSRQCIENSYKRGIKRFGLDAFPGGKCIVEKPRIEKPDASKIKQLEMRIKVSDKWIKKYNERIANLNQLLKESRITSKWHRREVNECLSKIKEHENENLVRQAKIGYGKGGPEPVIEDVELVDMSGMQIRNQIKDFSIIGHDEAIRSFMENGLKPILKKESEDEAKRNGKNAEEIYQKRIKNIKQCNVEKPLFRSDGIIVVDDSRRVAVVVIDVDDDGIYKKAFKRWYPMLNKMGGKLRIDDDIEYDLKFYGLDDGEQFEDVISKGIDALDVL
jgi:hypothetical protein